MIAIHLCCDQVGYIPSWKQRATPHDPGTIVTRKHAGAVPQLIRLVPLEIANGMP
jgi:hypothetical protein